MRLPMGGAAENMILVLGKLDALGCAEGSPVGIVVALVQSRRQRTAALQGAVHDRAQGRVEQPHAGGDVFAVGWRGAEVLAKQHRVVARHLGFEAAIAVVVGFDVAVGGHVVAISVREVEARLDAAEVAAPARRAVAEEGRLHVLDRVQPEPVALGGIERPHRRARQVILYPLRHRLAVGAVEPVPASRRPAKAGRASRQPASQEG